ncbi:MAG: cation diffusion facilitator family transporter [Gammaproteobacteria bacterium]|jgi:ferrous-iron efflux pump FieF|nr:MAG: cation diffusion facilitator family transporter [Gammaproteobacteria bacterium]
MTNDHSKDSLLRAATWASVCVACTLIGIKGFAYFVTGSVALLSSLIDSLLDAVSSILILLAVRHSLTPADQEHRFGHGKAEPLAGLGQAAFITGSSVFLVVEALNHLINPRPVENGFIGLVVTAVSLVMTIGLLLFQRQVIARTGSLAIKADSIHYLSDIVLNLSVFAALLLSTYFGLAQADPIFALGIAVYIIHSAWTIVKHAFDQLMDRELPEADRQRIIQLAIGHREVRDLHELRTRMAGQDLFIQLHLVLDRGISLFDAHRIADEVEMELRRAFPNADILIHQDPEGLETPREFN